ncbi:hypothetical protein GPALN_003090 [Globodera pallida]|nr:hypothetical protein GPALN_003090 [Globodera pallida]
MVGIYRSIALLLSLFMFSAFNVGNGASWASRDYEQPFLLGSQTAVAMPDRSLAPCCLNREQNGARTVKRARRKRPPTTRSARQAKQRRRQRAHTV